MNKNNYLEYFQKNFENRIDKALLNILKDDICENPIILNSLLEIIEIGTERQRYNASWLLFHVADSDSKLIENHQLTILQLIQKEKFSGHKRNMVRAIQTINIEPQNRILFFNTLFPFLVDDKEPIALKVFALTVCHHCIKTQPELLSELKLIAEELCLKYSEHNSIVSRYKFLFKK